MKKLLAGLALVSLVLVGCSGKKPEKDRYLSAMKDVSCLVLKSDNIFDPSLQEKAKDIVKSYGFDTSDDAAMKALKEKYKDDADVKAVQNQTVKDCGGAAAPVAPAADAGTKK
ncbi:hypothetical protein HZA40_04490 [Candidatus Peregrinibacteria bacterium]|nr:hypothetical protein [Candidatus Peregrinibacteria bacterium]